MNALIALLFVPVVDQDLDPFYIDRKIECDKIELVFEHFVTKYAEMPVWHGKDRNSGYLLLVNERTGSWTMLQYADDIACVLGVGVRSQIKPQEAEPELEL